MLNRQKVTVLLDLGANCSYVSTRVVGLARLRPTRRTEPYMLWVANRELILGEEVVTYKVVLQPL